MFFHKHAITTEYAKQTNFHYFLIIHYCISNRIATYMEEFGNVNFHILVLIFSSYFAVIVFLE